MKTKGMDDISIISKDLRRQITAAFALMTILPVLILGYFLCKYLMPNIKIPENIPGIILLTFVLSLLGFGMLRRIVMSISKLGQHIAAIANGDLTHVIEVQNGSDIARIGNSLSLILQRLQQNQQELKGLTEQLKDKVKERTRELEESKAYVDNIIKSMIDTLIVVDPKGTIKNINEATLDLLGYREEELIGEPVATVFAEEEEEEEEEEVSFRRSGIADLIEKGFIRNVEKTYLAKDGRKIPVLFSGSVMHDNDGRIQGIVCVALDITERKRAEEALRETNAFLENILDSSSSISIISTDLDRNILYWNVGAENILGYKAEETVGRHKIDILYPDEDTKKTIGKVRYSIIKNKKAISCQIREVTKDGQMLWVNISLTPRFDENGHMIGILGIGQDITEHKKMEEMRNDLIRDTAHALRSPIAILKMGLDMLQRGVETHDSERIKKGQLMLSNNLKRLQKDVDNVLEMFSLSEVETRETKVISLKAIIDEVAKDIRSSLEQKNVKLTIDISKNADKIIGNESDIRFLVANIIDNAVKFTKEGSITLTSKVKNRWIEIRLHDTGCGIADKDRDRIFEKFYRGHPAFPGAGLGLSICKAVVNRHNGTIDVLSEGEGKGTMVIVRLLKGGSENA